MTSDETVYQVLLESGIPGAKVGFPLGEAPPLPWFTYKRIKKGTVFADDRRWGKIPRYQVDLYELEPDENLRERFEQLVDRLGAASDFETWIPTENCWVTSYTLTFNPIE